MFIFKHTTSQDEVIKTTVLLLIPLIITYAFHIQLSGETSPGGGFQAGTTLSVAYILFMATFGVKMSDKLMSKKALLWLASSGCLLYILTGFTTLLGGYNYLEYTFFNFMHNGQATGLFIIELGVGLCVFGSISVIISTFYSLLKEI